VEPERVVVTVDVKDDVGVTESVGVAHVVGVAVVVTVAVRDVPRLPVDESVTEAVEVNVPPKDAVGDAVPD